MDRRRHEPTLGKSELDEIEFRPRSHRGPSAPPVADPFSWSRLIPVLLVLIVVALLLIEWNARRQAAAMTAELMRPMTAKEEAQLKAQLAQWERELEVETRREFAEFNRQVEIQMKPNYAPDTPLRAGQRCISGRRFERIDGGWRNLPYEPC